MIIDIEGKIDELLELFKKAKMNKFVTITDDTQEEVYRVTLEKLTKSQIRTAKYNYENGY